jgi:DNA-directed RNA polymerase subunit H (RpoH/RPB5)
MASNTAPSEAQVAKILKTMERLLQDRGYKSIQAFSLQQIFTLPASTEALDELEVLADVRFIARQNSDPTKDGCIVLLCLGRKIGVCIIRGIIELLERLNTPIRAISNVVLVHDSPADSGLQILSTRALEEFPTKLKYNVYCFEANHVTHPYPYTAICTPHRLLTPEEEKVFLEANKLDKSVLTQIDSNDPIIKWYGWAKNRVIVVRKTYGTLLARDQYELIV